MGQHHTGEQRTSLPSAETAAGNNLPPGNLCLRSGILMLSEALLGENTETFTIFFFFFLPHTLSYSLWGNTSNLFWVHRKKK